MGKQVQRPMALWLISGRAGIQIQVLIDHISAIHGCSYNCRMIDTCLERDSEIGTFPQEKPSQPHFLFIHMRKNIQFSKHLMQKYCHET